MIFKNNISVLTYWDESFVSYTTAIIRLNSQFLRMLNNIRNYELFFTLNSCYTRFEVKLLNSLQNKNHFWNITNIRRQLSKTKSAITNDDKTYR